MNQFEEEVAARISANRSNERLQAGAREFIRPSLDARYSYNFAWLGRPFGEAPFSKAAAAPDLLQFGSRTATALLQSISL